MLTRCRDGELVVVLDNIEDKYYNTVSCIKFEDCMNRVYDLYLFVINKISNSSRIDSDIKYKLNKRIAIVGKLLKPYKYNGEFKVDGLIEHLDEKISNINDMQSNEHKLEYIELEIDKSKIETDDRMLAFELSEEQQSNYSKELFIVLQNKTGDYKFDLEAELIEILAHNKLRITKDIKDNLYKYDVTKDGYIVDEINAMNRLMEQIVYILNSNSFNIGRLEDYDSIELDMRFEFSMAMLTRIPDFIRARAEMN